MLDVNQGLRLIARFFITMCMLATAFPSAAVAHENEEVSDDQKQIHHVLMAQWDKKESPLTVYPIVIAGDDAIAGWVQGERGGRALLRRSQHGWEVYMCGGADLKSQKMLEQAGINSGNAELLASKLKIAEQGMSSASRNKLSIFEGVMPVEANQHHAH